MKQINHHYPRFSQGQPLTSTTLNNSFGYIEEQSRLTRAELLGTGILTGLEYEYKGGVVRVKKGTALTPDGFLIRLEENKTYRVGIRITDENRGNIIKERLPLNGNEASNFSHFLEKVRYALYENRGEASRHAVGGTIEDQLPDFGRYVLAFVVDFTNSDESVRCSQLSCDSPLVKYQTEIRPVLVASDVFVPPLFSRLAPIKQCVTFERLVGLSNSINLKLLSQKIKVLFFSHRDRLLVAVREIQKLLCDPVWGGLLKNANASITRFNHFSTHLERLGRKMTEIPEPYVLHVQDLGEAVNEFICYYNEFISKYPLLPVNHEAFFDRVVFLGKGNSSTPVDYRQLYMGEFTQREFEVDRTILQKMFCRIFLLSEHFRLRGEEGLHFIWQTQKSNLGDRPIPYYYRNSRVFTENWGAHMLAPCADFARFSGCSIRTRSVGPHDVLLLQEYYMKNVYWVKEELEQYLAENEIPITVTTVALCKKRLTKEYRTRINGEFGAELDKKIPSLKTILDRAVVVRPISPEEMASLVPLLQDFISNKFGNNMNYQGRDLLAISALKSYMEKGYDGRCRQVYMLGGCVYGGQLFLLHFKGQLILSLGVCPRGESDDMLK